MKLAEALSMRSSLTEKAQQLKTRLKDCVKVQEGDTPVDSYEQIINQLDSTLDQLQKIIYQINITNTRTQLDGHSLTEMLARRDTLKMKVRAIAESLSYLSEREDRYHLNEIKYIRTVDVAEFRSLRDYTAAKLRQLALTIQSIGWATDLIEE